MSLIQTSVIAGGAVYGVEQVEYSIAGVDGAKDYSAALAAAAFRQTAAIEAAAAGYADLVRVRTRKIEDLGNALAVLNKAVASMRVKNAESDDKSDADDALKTAKSTLAFYGIPLDLVDGNKIRRKQAYTAQNDVQYAMDTEDNNLQQDLVALQGLLSKRDSAQSTAARVVRKADDAGRNTIGNIQ